MASSQSKFYGTLVLIALLGAGLIGYVATRGEPSSESADPEVVQPVGAGETISRDVGVAKGPKDASVVIEEYADFQCPYCGMVAQLTVPDVVKNYVETGKVRYIFFDFPVHPGEKSYLAAEAARCAGDQGAFWPMHDMLFSRMSEWASKRDPRGQFREYAGAIGIDAGALRECVDSRKYRNVVQANRVRGEQHGVNSTPTFFVNGRRIKGAVGFDQMSAVIEEELAKR